MTNHIGQKLLKPMIWTKEPPRTNHIKESMSAH